MPMYSPNSVLLNSIKTYFAHLNPIAQKIATDIDCTKSAYGDLWFTLSDNEKDDIINETLINPNITLQYYNINFTPSTTSRTSADSLHTICLRETDYTCLNSQKKSQQEEMKGYKKSENCYSFDGDCLRTYAIQKVGLKIVQDEILGMFRDEHSIPFSYRTKSQINLLNKDLNSTDYIDCNEKKTINIYHKSPKELNQKINNQKNYKTNLIIKEDKNNCTGIKFLENSKTKNNIELECHSNSTAAGTYAMILNKGHEVSKKKQTHTPDLNTYQAVMSSEAYFENDEYANLINNCVGSDSIATSIFSVTSSEDDQFDGDEENRLCEEVGLLDNDNTLRSGFDFLKNW